MRLHALVPAYPAGFVSSCSCGPRAWARLADAGRAFFLALAGGHGWTVRRAAVLGNAAAVAPYTVRFNQIVRQA